jgi:hypothetical protein
MFKNPKRSQSLVIGNSLAHRNVFVIWIWVIWHCFEFRASIFEFPSGKENSSVGPF